MRFPATKRRLNALQAQAIAQAGGVQATRGPLRDALTLFDENAALLQAPKPLWQALQARDWHALCVTHRALWAQARLVLFGHALLEKMVAPYKSITAHVLCLPVPPELGPPPLHANADTAICQSAPPPVGCLAGAATGAGLARAQALHAAAGAGGARLVARQCRSRLLRRCPGVSACACCIRRLSHLQAALESIRAAPQVLSEAWHDRRPRQKPCPHAPV